MHTYIESLKKLLFFDGSINEYTIEEKNEFFYNFYLLKIVK